ncbi:hypothetical protein WMY93_020688 [Mugilogobius chulae]|uniref:L-type lectin-like domain-containing protein n=1 Tax=Mugilogobius chulae TaxID=88201 RepID=A0AAW0NFN4_9GOBI
MDPDDGSCFAGVGSLGSSHWELMGDAMPCHLKDWEMQVHFKIHGQGKKNLNGDGLALVHQRTDAERSCFGNMATLRSGCVVDTYPNEEKHLEAQKKRYTPRTEDFPSCLAMVGNGTISYDHERDGRPTELGACNAMVRNLNTTRFFSSDTSAADSR